VLDEYQKQGEADTMIRAHSLNTDHIGMLKRVVGTADLGVLHDVPLKHAPENGFYVVVNSKLVWLKPLDVLVLSKRDS
jgi:hypothetical protein